MIALNLQQPADRSLKILCIGAHSDDIEIGCGGTILRLTEQYPGSELQWVVLSAVGEREAEARRGAELFAGAHLKSLILKTIQDGFMPYLGADVKKVFENELKALAPDIVFTHNGQDAHQDHRLLSELTWNTFRNQLTLEYEIPKYDGDLGRPSVFAPLSRETSETKIQHLMDVFRSQQTKHWFQPETFRSMMRLRGMECAAPSGYAEAFYCRKLCL
jgi:LmbE family N-acetylglucosaminyl deacetylase